MITNSDMTLYSRGYDQENRTETWTRSEVKGVAWESTHAATVLAAGTQDANRFTVYIPMERGGTYKEGDIIVKGTVTKTIGPEYTIGDLKKEYPHAGTIRSVDTHQMGSIAIHHWEIGAT